MQKKNIESSSHQQEGRRIKIKIKIQQTKTNKEKQN